AHCELFKRVVDLPGALVECGVFKGASLARFAMLRSLYGQTSSRQIVAFDTFDLFPPTQFEADKPVLDRFIAAAGDRSISIDQMRAVLAHKGCDADVQLVAGDICETVPRFAREHPDFQIALLNLDTDVYEPAKIILEH